MLPAVTISRNSISRFKSNCGTGLSTLPTYPSSGPPSRLPKANTERSTTEGGSTVARPIVRDRRSAFAVVFCAAGAAFASCATFAAEDDSAPLDEITVTGSRITRDGVTTPTPVTVVNAERLQNLGAPNIGQVLNTLPSFRATSNPQT